MYTYAITLDNALHRFPFLARIKITGDADEIGPHQVIVSCWSQDFEKQQFCNLSDQRRMGGEGGWKKHAIFTISQEGFLKRLNMRLGQNTIYPAQQLAYPEEFPDDVHTEGETLKEALRREKKRADRADKYVVIHIEGNIREQGTRKINLSVIFMRDRQAVKEIKELAQGLWEKRSKPKGEDKIDWAAAQKQLCIPNEVFVGKEWCYEINEHVVPALP